jgi:hypothetical protein
MLRRFLTRALGGALLLVSLSAAAVATAAEQAAVEEPVADGWTFEIAPYLWLPEMEGTLSAGPLSAPIDVDIDELFDLIFDGELLAGGLHLGAQWGRFSLFVDGFGGGAKPSEKLQRGKLDVTLNFAFIEFGPAYRVLDLPVRPGGRSIQVDALVGGRFMYFYDSIEFEGSRGIVNFGSDATTTWVDPFVGGRWRVPLVGELDMVFRGDIGGFDVGSKLAWNLIGGFQYGLPWRAGDAQMSVVAAYKAFDFDYEGSGSRQGQLALNLRGPLLGVMFNF